MIVNDMIPLAVPPHSIIDELSVVFGMDDQNETNRIKFQLMSSQSVANFLNTLQIGVASEMPRDLVDHVFQITCPDYVLSEYAYIKIPRFWHDRVIHPRMRCINFHM